MDNSDYKNISHSDKTCILWWTASAGVTRMYYVYNDYLTQW